MASLTGNTIAGSYLGLIKTVDNEALTSVTKSITDGAGNATPLFLATNLVKVSGSQQITGSLRVTNGSSANQAILTSANLTVETTDTMIGTYMDEHGIAFFSGSDFLDITVQGQNFGDFESGSLIAVSDAAGDPAVLMKFQNFGNWTDGTVTVVRPLQMQSGSRVTGSVNVLGTVTATSFTGSLQGTAVNASALNSTSSLVFANTGSNVFTGNQTVSGSLRMFESASLIIPTYQPTSPVKGTMFFSASFIYVYDGSAFKSASLS